MKKKKCNRELVKVNASSEETVVILESGIFTALIQAGVPLEAAQRIKAGKGIVNLGYLEIGGERLINELLLTPSAQRGETIAMRLTENQAA